MKDETEEAMHKGIMSLSCAKITNWTPVTIKQAIAICSENVKSSKDLICAICQCDLYDDISSMTPI